MRLRPFPAFARTHNLKVHIKSVHFHERSHRCMEPRCTRAFSRKHDLTRHMVSIHRAESVTALSTGSSIGVEGGRRAWCDHCGRSWLDKGGKEKGCECNDVK